jgi:hypothetical protein
VPKQTILLVVLAAAGLLAHHAANADVFRCKSAAGKILYTDAPCPEGMHTTDVTTAVQVCGSADCLARREQGYREAEARRRAEREEFAAMMEERHRRAREEAWLESLQPRVVTVPVPVAPEYFDPGYAVVAAPLRTRCAGAQCVRPVHHRAQRPASAAKPRGQCADERCATGVRPEQPRSGARGRT